MSVLRIFVPFALGYFMSYLLRVVNAVIAPDLIRDLGLDAADLGLLTSANFLAFGAFQIPLGILLDRYGPRRTEAVLLLVAAAGALLFGLAGGKPELIVGRAMIGLGTSACLMAAFKAYRFWFTPDRLPLVSGVHLAVGGLGALAGTIPVEFALGFTDWRGVFMIFAPVCLTASIAIFLFVPKNDRVETSESFAEQLHGMGRVVISPLFLRIAPATVTAQASFLSLQSLWAGPWLRDVAGFEHAQMADGLFMIAAFMVLGFLSHGAIVARFQRLAIQPATVAMYGVSLSVLAIVLLGSAVTEFAVPLWVAFGFFGSFGVLPYSALSQAFPEQLTGRVVTSLNVLTFSGAFILQWGIGIIIDLWPQPAPDHFAVEGYRAGFLLVALLQALGIVWYCVYRKTAIRV